MKPGVDSSAPKPKRSGRGCLIVLGVLGGLVLIGGLAIAVAVYHFSKTEEGQKVFGMMGKATQMAARAQSAPGTSELKKLGCDTAMVMNAREMLELAADFIDAGAPTQLEHPVMVICQVGMFSESALSCDEVARTYAGAVPGGNEPFTVTVQRPGRGKPECMARYAPSGDRLE